MKNSVHCCAICREPVDCDDGDADGEIAHLYCAVKVYKLKELGLFNNPGKHMTLERGFYAR